MFGTAVRNSFQVPGSRGCGKRRRRWIINGSGRNRRLENNDRLRSQSWVTLRWIPMLLLFSKMRDVFLILGRRSLWDVTPEFFSTNGRSSHNRRTTVVVRRCLCFLESRARPMQNCRRAGPWGSCIVYAVRPVVFRLSFYYDSFSAEGEVGASWLLSCVVRVSEGVGFGKGGRREGGEGRRVVGIGNQRAPREGGTGGAGGAGQSDF